MYTNIHTYTHTMHVYICTQIHGKHIYIYMYIYIHAYIYIYIHIHTYIHTCIRTHIHDKGQSYGYLGGPRDSFASMFGSICDGKNIA